MNAGRPMEPNRRAGDGKCHLFNACNPSRQSISRLCAVSQDDFPRLSKVGDGKSGRSAGANLGANLFVAGRLEFFACATDLAEVRSGG